jgi:trehalose 6-phosphate synthase
MTGRLIVVSNRIPAEGPPSGGLVVALHEALKDGGGLWIGAHPETQDDVEGGLVDLSSDSYELKAFRVSEQDRQNFYLGYSNSILWPIFHGRTDLARIDRAFSKGYISVNERVAGLIAGIAKPDDLIWIHDYHFLPLAHFLRRHGVTARIGLFLHIPFPEPSHAEAIPERDMLSTWLGAHDLVGLQTKRDVARGLEFFRSDRHAEFMPDGRIKVGPRTVALRSFPIGIDTEGFLRDAVAHRDEVPEDLREIGPIVIGVDRLDYTKGIGNRLLAFEEYLRRLEKGAPRASLLQIAPASREEVDAYRAAREELEGLAGRINGDFASLDFTPIRFLHSSLPRETLAPLYRLARVGLVTPFADGMNLVAKEYVAAQSEEDPGVLVLSRMAGAAEDLDAALIVNPYNTEETADAIVRALSMPLEERQDRHAALLAATRATDIALWCQSFIEALGRTERQLFPDFTVNRARGAPGRDEARPGSGPKPDGTDAPSVGSGRNS